MLGGVLPSTKASRARLKVLLAGVAGQHGGMADGQRTQGIRPGYIAGTKKPALGRFL